MRLLISGSWVRAPHRALHFFFLFLFVSKNLNMFSLPIQPIPSAPNIFFFLKGVIPLEFFFYLNLTSQEHMLMFLHMLLDLPYRVFLIFTISPHFSSLAVSLCWASSSISGREVMISRCTPKGATLTTSSS